MSTVAAPTTTPESIFQLAQGFMASKLFFVAGEIGLFEQLADGPKSAAEVAANLHLPVRSVGVVANAMVALGMLTLDNDRYRNSDTAQAFLTGLGPADMRPLLTLFNRLSYPTWNGLGDTVRNDGKKDTILDFSQEDQGIFSAGVEAASSGGAMALATSYDFGRHRALLDIGGGTGSFLKIIGRQHPHLELTLFELPRAASYARSRVRPNDATRIKIVEGDVLKERLPSGFDVMLLSHVVHCLSVEENRVVLAAAHNAASASGRLLIVEFFLDDTKTAPVACTLMSAEFLMKTNGISYSTTEIRRLAELIGWRFVEHRPLAGPVSLMVLEK
jgi:O-methyltransferase domain/Dimerisation domain